ncbi:hypothetical protein K439DRAFT_1618968 [Ramaria rubella]|nr:hypothetical protein K439DRAFT_1618968 [Ramaria rubella]
MTTFGKLHYSNSMMVLHEYIAAIQTRNVKLFWDKLYNGQQMLDPQTANVRYKFLPSDSTWLYRKFSQLHGIDMEQPPQYNIDDWLNPKSAAYNQELAAAVFHYQACAEQHDHLCICIQTSDMKEASWEYAHQKQVILDGTFGVCESCVLLFVALGIDESGKGVPLTMFLFSAPTGTKATQAGYDIFILYQLLKEWRDSLGCWNGVAFKPLVAITDTDTKECRVLTLLWPDIWLLLCKFHVRQCWSNQRKKVIHMGQGINFPKQQVRTRLHVLEDQLLASVEHDAAIALVEDKKQVLNSLKWQQGINVAANAGLSFLKYLMETWLLVSLWLGWSQQGCMQASQILWIPVEGVIPTTNHLEAFNGVLKHKYIPQWPHGGKRLRLDLFVYLLIMQILPGMFALRSTQDEYYSWMTERFWADARGVDLVAACQKLAPAAQLPPAPQLPVAWWTADH